MRKLIGSVLILLCFIFKVNAQDDETKIKYIIDIPVFDSPANLEHHGLAYKQFSPSMQQALGFSKSISQTQQYYTKRLFFKPNKEYSLGGKIWRESALGFSNYLIDKVIVTTPLGIGWTHEEWHRAVLNKNNVRSYNNMNKFPVFAAGVSVNQVTDEDLANFKANNNADFVRMGVAGVEAQYEYVKAMQADNFYYKLNLSSTTSYWINLLNAKNYIQSSASAEADAGTAEAEIEEGTDISERDFTGLDFTAWMYDLANPDESYYDRGVSPTGVGVRRYRKTTDLTADELAYLEKMGKLQWLNIVSPTMFFVNSIKVNEDFRFNFGLFHYLNSFGYDQGSNFFGEYKGHKLFLAVHNYHNYENSFFGIEAKLIDKEFTIKNRDFLITPSLHLWSQPKDFAFKTSDSEFGGKFGILAATKFGKIWQPYIELSAKTEGWVAGDVYQTSNFNSLIGIRAFIQ